MLRVECSDMCEKGKKRLDTGKKNRYVALSC